MENFKLFAVSRNQFIGCMVEGNPFLVINNFTFNLYLLIDILYLPQCWSWIQCHSGGRTTGMNKLKAESNITFKLNFNSNSKQTAENKTLKFQHSISLTLLTCSSREFVWRRCLNHLGLRDTGLTLFYGLTLFHRFNTIPWFNTISIS